MWYIEEFDRSSETLIREHPLPALRDPDVRRILNVHDDLPIEPFGFDIPDSKTLEELSTFGQATIRFDASITYQLGFYTD